MTTYDRVLEGCSPVPLAGYLKGIGILRLIAEQADERARGFWRDERFVLRTTLSEVELIRFLVETYRPTPVVAPWNGASGFWPKGNRNALNVIKTDTSSRLNSYRGAIRFCEELIAAKGLSRAPKEEKKAAFIIDLRAGLSDEACRWLDGAIALTTEGPSFPTILGTGGNDGHLDFSNNFMQRLVQVFRSKSETNAEMLQSSLFYVPSAHLEQGAVGQFSPGSAGGVNASNGFEADSRVNPWDFILTMEGALSFAATVVRRFAEDRRAFSFPFTAFMVGAGCGNSTFEDEPDSRGEFWAPLWARPATFDELLQLMSEGRAVLGARAAHSGLDIARAVSELGIARGIDDFVRYGFLMRAGQSFFATSLDRVRVQENPRASLISELDTGGWLRRARAACRDKNASASLRQTGRNLDESLFRLAADGSCKTVQEALVALGELMLNVARGSKLGEKVPPPPRLSEAWTIAGDDGSPEFALSEALASLDTERDELRLPFRRHLAPLNWDRKRKWWIWGIGTDAEALAVWTGRDLAGDMASVLERRVIEAQRRHSADQGKAGWPLFGWRSAPLAAVAAFLGRQTDDERIAALVAALAWVNARRGAPSTIAVEGVLPFAYCALKALFVPGGIEPVGKNHVLNSLPLVRLIRSGRIDEAQSHAQAVTHRAGLATVFACREPNSVVDSDRLAAALLIPIAQSSYLRLIHRAYPALSQDNEKGIHAS
jgi:CRISPR-associated protein Csx17